MQEAYSAASTIETNERATRTHLWLYLGGFVAVQVLLLLLVVTAATTSWFMTHDNYPGMLPPGYSLRLKHADCDVVLYGDSSALTGLDPEIVQQITGLKTCNLAEGGTIEGVVGSRFPLDAYLKNNKRPRFLLATYTPSQFRPYRKPFEGYQPEGVLYALQYDRGRQLFIGLLQRPGWVVRFGVWAGHAIIEDFWNRHFYRAESTASVDQRALRDDRHGIWQFPLPPETGCVREALHMNSGKVERFADSVAQMQKIYGTEGTTVIIDLSPVPSCDPLQQVYRQQSEGLHANPFESLPISYFNEEDVHFSPEGSRYISIEAAHQILALEKSQITTHSSTEGPVEAR